MNGSQGVVVALDDDGPQVRFGDAIRSIRPMDWTMESGGDHTVVARIRQVPLRLAYAITIHSRRIEIFR